jgi:hypothetical protein
MTKSEYSINIPRMMQRAWNFVKFGSHARVDCGGDLRRYFHSLYKITARISIPETNYFPYSPAEERSDARTLAGARKSRTIRVENQTLTLSLSG